LTFFSIPEFTIFFTNGLAGDSTSNTFGCSLESTGAALAAQSPENTNVDRTKTDFFIIIISLISCCAGETNPSLNVNSAPAR
jgi:hypothetical protein